MRYNRGLGQFRLLVLVVAGFQQLVFHSSIPLQKFQFVLELCDRLRFLWRNLQRLDIFSLGLGGGDQTGPSAGELAVPQCLDAL